MEPFQEQDLEYVGKLISKRNGKVIISIFKNKKTNKKYLVKQIEYNEENVEHSELNKKLEEVRALYYCLRLHKNVVKILGFYVTTKTEKKYLCIVFKYYPEGDLRQFIKKLKENKRYLTEYEIMRMVMQLVEIFSNLQQDKIAHRDIKSQNILVKNDGNTLKLTDMGEVLKVQSDESDFQIVGTTVYMSPKVSKAHFDNLNIVRHNVFKSDVYSFGIVIIEILSHDEDNIIRSKLEREPNYIESITQDYKILKEILNKMLSENEGERYDFLQLKVLVESHFERYSRECINCYITKLYDEFYNTGQEQMCKTCINNIQFTERFCGFRCYCFRCMEIIDPALRCGCRGGNDYLRRCRVCKSFHDTEINCFDADFEHCYLDFFFECKCGSFEKKMFIYNYEIYCLDCEAQFCIVCLNFMNESRHEACQFYLRNSIILEARV